MKAVAAAGIAFLLCVYPLRSQDFLLEGKRSPRVLDASVVDHRYLHASVIQKPFDVLHYSLDAHLAMVDSSFRGVMRIHVRITQPTDTLWFHAVGLTFDSVLVDGVPAVHLEYPSQERFAVYLPSIPVPADTVIVTIGYERNLEFPRFEEQQGYYWYRKDSQPGHVHENIGYTMSEPFDARLWMPCFDNPNDKATADINITVPDGYVAGSNGRLLAVETNPDNTVTFRWRSEYPITTYLMVITASRYSTYSEYYRKITNPSDSIEVYYYMWQADSAGWQFNTRQAYSKTVRMMEVYSKLFGEYPFEKYGMAVVYPFFYAGMEHQTLSTMHRSTVSVANYPHYEFVVAHELAHQWWGNMVTCETFADIWLNEGFATYAEALWEEEEYGRERHDQRMRRYLLFGSTWRGALYDPLSQGLPMFGSQVYHKGAWVLYMLRSLVGDSLFFSILSNYRATHEHATAKTADFQQVVGTTVGESYAWFFDQWVYGRGWPEYAYTTVWNPNNRTYTVNVYQMQDTLWPTFRMPIELKIWTNGVPITHTVVDSLRVQSFVFEKNVRPDSLQFDAGNRILKRMVNPPQGEVNRDELPDAFRLFQNYPNPFNASTLIEYHLPVRTHVRLEIFDILGRRLLTLIDGEQGAGTHLQPIVGTGLASGVYFYRLLTPERTLSRTMNILK